MCIMVLISVAMMFVASVVCGRLVSILTLVLVIVMLVFRCVGDVGSVYSGVAIAIYVDVGHTGDEMYIVPVLLVVGIYMFIFTLMLLLMQLLFVLLCNVAYDYRWWC